MIRIVVLAAFLLPVAGCRGSDEPPSGEQRGEPYLRCAPPMDDGKRESFSLPPLEVTRDGCRAEIRGLDRGVVILGLLAGIHEPAPANLSNVRFFLERFRNAGAQVVAVAGGLGLKEEDVRGVLGELSAAPVPVLLVPGAQESFDVVRRTVTRMRERHPQLLDMTLVRKVKIGRIALVSLPGYHKAHYLEAKERGCAYEPGDLADVAALVDRGETGVLIAASPPRGKGPAAVDMGRGGVNIGDAALAGMLSEAAIRFGLFGHAYESGGHATRADGATPIAEGVWQDSLFVQAGAADAVPLSLVGEGRSVGMAQIVEISGARARYRTISAPARTP